MRESVLLIKSTITDRIGQREVILAITHKNYMSPASQTGQKAGERRKLLFYKFV